jgi:hypothetical protein
MKRMPVLNRLGPLRKLIRSLAGPDGGLNPVFLYQDAETRHWARVVSEALKQPAGTWWKLEDLSHPGVLAGAVSKAMRAEVVVIAVREREGLPLPFYVWVNAWLAHRLPGRGALVGLLAAPAQPSLGSDRVGEYLRAVAQEGQIRLFLEEMIGKPRRSHATPSPAQLMPPPLSRQRLRHRGGGRAGGLQRTPAASGAWSAPARGGLGRWAGT